MDRERAREGLRGSDRAEGAGTDRGKGFRHADDWPLDRYAVVERAWPGATVVCIAGGHSESADVERVRRWRAAGAGYVIGINDAYRLADFCDVLYFADARWWGWHYRREEFTRLACELVTIKGSEGCSDTPKEAHAAREAAIDAGRLWWLANYGNGDVLSARRNGLATGMNGGYQAINLAYLLGASRVVLLGYSMKPLADGRAHWFGDHPVKTSSGIFSAMLSHYRALARALPPGFQVINATRDTALDCFPRATLESLLSDPTAAALSA